MPSPSRPGRSGSPSPSAPQGRHRRHDDKALQAAVDYVARFGGGTVKILPGTYRLRNAVYLASKVRLLGSGADTVLIKEPSVDHEARRRQRLVRPGDHARRRDRLRGRRRRLPAREEPATPAVTEIVKRTLVARTGNRFKLDQALARRTSGAVGETKASTLFPILSGENIADVAIENLTLDGNRANNDNLDGNYAGCIFLQDCNRVDDPRRHGPQLQRRRHQLADLPRRARRELHSEGHAGLGLHPGSGSQRPSCATTNRRKRHRHLLLLGREVRPRGEQSRRGQPHRHLHRPSRHRQHRARQRSHRQQKSRRPLPARARQGLRRQPQPHREQPDRRQRRRTTASPSTSRAAPNRSSSRATKS